MHPSDRLVALLAEPDFALDEALLLVAAVRPDAEVDVARSLGELDQIAASCPNPTLDGLTLHLYTHLGFSGDHVDYHNPRNSFLDQVIRRRTGMPITLSVVLLETGRRIGVPLDGVAMPGHFLVRDKVLVDVFVDAFGGGSKIDADECRHRFHAIHGAEAEFDPHWLDPVGPHAIVNRVLDNLAHTYRHRSPGDLDWLIDLRAALPRHEFVSRSLVEMCMARGRYDEAARFLESIADETGPDRLRARSIRARLN